MGRDAPVLRVFVGHYNRERPHRALNLQPSRAEGGQTRSVSGVITGRERVPSLHEPRPCRLGRVCWVVQTVRDV